MHPTSQLPYFEVLLSGSISKYEKETFIFNTLLTPSFSLNVFNFNSDSNTFLSPLPLVQMTSILLFKFSHIAILFP